MPKDPHARQRKKKLEAAKLRAHQAQSLVYTGEKYKKDKLIPTWMNTEIGIYQTYVMTDRKIIDQTVATALETLIRQMRAGELPPLPESTVIHYEQGQEVNLVIENIRRSWAAHYATAWRPPNDDLIGVLRTILGSMEKVQSPGPGSQGYLRHIAGFLTKQLGVTVKSISTERKPLPEPESGELVRLEHQPSAAGDPT